MSDLFYCAPVIVVVIVVLILRRVFKNDEPRYTPERRVSSDITIQPLPRKNKVTLWQYGSKIANGWGRTEMSKQDLEDALIRAKAAHDSRMVRTITEALSYIQERTDS